VRVTVTASGPDGQTSASAATSAPAAQMPAPHVRIARSPSASARRSRTVSYTETGTVSSTACALDDKPVRCTSMAAQLTGLRTGAHRFTVTVSGPGGSASATAAFTTTGPGPVAKASARRLSKRSAVERYALDGRGSLRGETQIVSYRWYDARGHLIARTAVAYVELRRGRTYRYRLRVTDGAGAVALVTITVKA